ncbi:alpha/beta hydrolase [Hydrogenophaga sp. PAMC20947]|uniref:alpha/beta hydrolase n=1 Tax=Hydrogenophaga sp. PAMC20947 TaxID=2565558 RepID=UPI00109DBC4D|nr:alpha/beta hydrolase [Hydrogenophaga sp. PAMC20947]QCB47922.1 alpha/beta hydrolase [Hydrogenophaga sp. PAMC20947]
MKPVCAAPTEPLPKPDRRRQWLAAIGLLPLLQACSPLGLINALVPNGSHTLIESLPYGLQERQRMDVYLPKPAVQGAPMAVFFYGGSWNSGERADYKFVGEALAAQGIVTVVADYRLSPEVRYPVFLQDSAEAVKRALDSVGAWGVSPQRVFLMGHSAGAYNAAMLALDARWLQEAGASREQIAGWIGLAGPYDFLPIRAPDVQEAFAWPDTPLDSQPLFHARRPDAAAPPRVLLIAARKDNLVNPERNTLGLAQALSERGQTVRVELFDGVSHTTLMGAMAAPLRGLAPVLDTVRQFLVTTPS